MVLAFALLMELLSGIEFLYCLSIIKQNVTK